MKLYYLKKKKESCIHLNMKDITDADNSHVKKFLHILK